MTDSSSEQTENPGPRVEQVPESIPPHHQSIDLNYPQLLLNGSFSSLLTNSVPSATSSSTTDMPSYATESNLGESWASLSTDNHTSEDDLQSVNTDTGSLVDLPGTDDVLSLYEADASSEGGLPESVDSEHIIIGIAPPAATPPITENVDDQHPVDTPHLASIEFEEPEQWPDAEHIDLRHTLKVFNENEITNLGHVLSVGVVSNKLVGTLRMTMSRKHLAVDQPFKVLFYGEDLESRAQILRKVADALVSGTDFTSDYRRMDFSRYHVIPLEFGPGSYSNQAEMIPIQTQIIVDDCMNATSSDDGRGREHVILAMKKGEQIHFRKDGIWQNVRERRSWILPQLAVVLLRRHDSLEVKRAVQLLHNCMTRHHIPILIISEENTWDGPLSSLVVNHPTLHRCIETSVPGSAAYRVLTRLPIGLESFLNLDPEQLNKHIAGLSSICTDLRKAHGPQLSFVPGPTRPRQSPETQDVEKNLSKSIIVVQNKPDSVLTHLLAYKDSASLILMWLLVIWAAFSVSYLVQWPAWSVETRLSPSNTSKLPETTSLTSSATLPLSTPKATERLLPTLRGQTDLTQLRSNSFFQTLNTSDRFLVQVVGDCHIVVKTPRTLLQKRKKPDVRIRISRGDEEIIANTSQLFDGVYTIKIAREDAHGRMNTTISTGRGSVKQSFEVDFGGRLATNSVWDYLATLGSFDHVSPMMQRFIYPLTNLTNLIYTTSRRTIFGAVQPSQDVLRTIQGFGTGLNRYAEAISEEIRWQIRNEIRWAEKTWVRDFENAWHNRSDYLDQAQERIHNIKNLSVQHLEQIYQSMADQMYALDVSTRAKEVWQDVTQSDVLAKAQDRARKMVEDVRSKFRHHQSRVQRRRAAKRATKGRRSSKMR